MNVRGVSLDGAVLGLPSSWAPSPLFQLAEGGFQWPPFRFPVWGEHTDRGCVFPQSTQSDTSMMRRPRPPW